MDFRLTDDQLELQAYVRGFCTRYADLAALEAAPLAGWADLAALDVLRVAVATESGGLGLGFVDASAVFEVLGEHLVPGPLVWSALAARFVPALSDGSTLITGTHDVSEGVLIPWGADAAAVLLVDVGGVWSLDASFAAIEPADPLTQVALAGQPSRGRRLGDAALASEFHRCGALLSAAFMVGLAERSLGAAVAYARQRQQFGRPIGSFQAIKHLLADAYVRASLARSATYAAAALADDATSDAASSGDAARAAAAAKALAGDAAIRNARTCIQVHGGMGFTWEMVPHYLLKRAWVYENAFGTRSSHNEARAAALDRELIV